ncbi:MAG: sulfotransferase [Caldilineaceae bacterium]
MQVIGAGFGRTGTESTQAALEKLLGGKCYHMKEVLNRREHLQAWTDFAERGCTGMDWHWLMQDYVAGVDWPICNYYRELMEAFPDAKVLLTFREPEKWYASLQTLIRITTMTRRLAVLVPMFRRMQILVEKATWHIFPDIHDKESAIAVYNHHVAAVQAHVPPERLLVFQVQEGWEPLCTFLGVPVPDEPFPHMNKRGDTQKFAQRMVTGQLLQRVGVPILLLLVVVVAYLLVMR